MKLVEVTVGIRDESGKFLGSVRKQRPEDESLTGNGTQRASTILTDEEMLKLGLSKDDDITACEV